MNLRRLISRLLVLPLLFGLSFPAVAAAQAHTVTGDLTAFFNGFKALFRGNTGGFVDGIVAAAPLLGLFFVVFGLAFYLSRLTIFKGNDNAQMDRYARWVATGIALLGVAQQSVYNTVLAWSNVFLTIAFITLVIFMFILFLNKTRSSHLGELTHLHKATSENLQAKKELLKLKHEVKHDKKLYAKTEHDLADLRDDLERIDHLGGDELKQVDRLAELLRKVTSSANTLDDKGIHPYVQQLSREVGTLITTMQHERKWENKTHQHLRKLDEHLKYLAKDESTERNQEKHIEHVIERYLHHHHDYVAGDDDIKDIKKRLSTNNEHGSIRGAIMSIIKSTEELKALKEEVRKHMQNATKFGFQTKYDAAKAVQDSIMTQAFEEANKRLYELRNMIRYEQDTIHILQEYDQKMLVHTHDIDRKENELTALLTGIVKSLDLNRDEDKEKQKVYDKFKDNLLGELENFKTSLRTIAGLAHDLQIPYVETKIKSQMHFGHGEAYDEQKLVKTSDEAVKSFYHGINGIFSDFIEMYEEVKKLKKGEKTAKYRERFMHFMRLAYDLFQTEFSDKFNGELAPLQKVYHVLEGHIHRVREMYNPHRSGDSHNVFKQVEKWHADKKTDGSEAHKIEEIEEKYKERRNKTEGTNSANAES